MDYTIKTVAIHPMTEVTGVLATTIKLGGIKMSNFEKKAVIGIVLGVFILIILLSAFTTVPSGHVGVVSTMGAINENVRSEGLNFKIPFIQSIMDIEVRTIKIEWADLKNPITAASKDLQDVFMLAVITYHHVPSKAAIIYRDIGLDVREKKVVPLGINAIKTHTAKYNVAEILQNRETITRDVNNDLAEQLIGVNIILENVSLTNIDFRPEYKAAIEATQIAQKQVDAQRFTLQKQELEAQQKVKSAEADKESKILASEGIKQSKILEGEGILEYNNKISKSITGELMEYKKLENQAIAIEKWDGMYPTTVMGGGTVPLIQIPISN